MHCKCGILRKIGHFQRKIELLNNELQRLPFDSEQMNRELAKPFTILDIENPLKQMAPNKNLGEGYCFRQAFCCSCFVLLGFNKSDPRDCVVVHYHAPLTSDNVCSPKVIPCIHYSGREVDASTCFPLRHRVSTRLVCQRQFYQLINLGFPLLP